MAELLETLFSLIWEKITFPFDWKVSVIIPVFKKGNKYNSHNYRGISRMDMATKVFTMIMLKKLEEARYQRTHENQCGFRRGRGCTDQISTLRLIVQQCERYNLPIINISLDFVAVFDSVTRENLWQIVMEDGMPVKFIELLKAYYEHCKLPVRVLGEETEPFIVKSSVKQGCLTGDIVPCFL